MKMSINREQTTGRSRLAACLLATLTLLEPALSAENDLASSIASSEQEMRSTLEISASGIDFGGVAPGEAESVIVVLTNTGTAESGSIVIDNLFLDVLGSKF